MELPVNAALPVHYVPAPCRGCGKPIVFVTAYSGQQVAHKVPLDPATPVYSRESDGDGGAVWLAVPPDVILARHVCVRTGAQP